MPLQMRIPIGILAAVLVFGGPFAVVAVSAGPTATAASPQGKSVCERIRCLRVAGDKPVAIQQRARAWADVVGTIPANAQDVIPLGDRATSASIEWILVEYKGVRGWVPAQFLTEASPQSTTAGQCENLIAPGARMICSGFEPSWAVRFTCTGSGLTADFIDPATHKPTPGTVRFSSQNPWALRTSHGLEGMIVHAPAGCQDENEEFFDYSLYTTAIPGFRKPVIQVCCRVVRQ